MSHSRLKYEKSAVCQKRLNKIDQMIWDIISLHYFTIASPLCTITSED